MQKKEDKVGNKTIYKEGRQRKKYTERDWERSEIDPKKSCNFGLCASVKKKMFIIIFLFNYIPLVGNMPSVLQTSLLAILMIVKNQFKKGIGENIFFSFLAGRHQSVNWYIWA